MRFNVLLVLFLNHQLVLFAQNFEKGFKPLKTSSKESIDLVSAIQRSHERELNRYPREERVLATGRFYRQQKFLIRLIKNGGVLIDDRLQSTVLTTIKKISTANRLSRYPNQIVILNYPFANAFSFGEGTLGITIGLLNEIQYEDELAFTASHEIAHLDLDHTFKDIARDVDSRYSHRIKSGAKKIFSEKDNLSEEDLNRFRSIVYQKSEYSRNLEREADSLAFILLMNSGFSKTGISQLLRKLNIKKDIELHAELFDPLTSSKYPFQISWLHGEADSIRQSDGLFVLDSIRSHPSLESRKSYLELLISRGDYNEYEATELADSVKTLLNFEMIESALFVKEADLIVQLSLELLLKYPTNDYLITRLAEVLLDGIEAKKNNNFYFHLPQTTVDFNDHRLLCYNFLKNVKWEELGEVSFNFLNNSARFNKSNEVHYYLLWKIADLTNREIVKKSIVSAYESNFKLGRLRQYMKSEIPFKQVAKTVLSINN